MTQPQPLQPASTSSVVLDSLGVELVALYTQAEQQMIGDTAQVLRPALGSPALGQQQILGQLRRLAQRIATRLHLRALPLSRQIALLAAEQGDRAAFRELRRTVDSGIGLTGHALASANQIAVELASKLTAVEHGILRFAEDAYRTVIAHAAHEQVLSRLTPGSAQALAWRRLTERGIVGYTDRAGRKWNLASYVEMATRTAVQRAFNASHETRLLALGVNYFTINHDGHPCPLCRPFEGRVLSRYGTEHDAVSLTRAESEGLFHPNCRHVLLPYFPGVTQLGGVGEWTPADEAQYRATQHLRALERRVRSYKYQELAALNDVDRKRAAMNVRAAQAAIRNHVAANNLVRRTRREQLDLGNR